MEDSEEHEASIAGQSIAAAVIYWLLALGNF
jgi:hypothetical protein